jgi:hypothetical protein
VAQAPRASLAHGAAGVAYFLFRQASFGRGQPALEAAALWASHAARVRGQRGAFLTRGGPLSSIPGAALHYHEPGVWWMRSLVAAARNDRAEVRRSTARFAEAAVDADGDSASLCCGRAGQGFAALTLYRATSERRWLTAAHRVAADAVRAAADEDAPAHQLFAGELGVMLLAAELEDPARAAMPVYETIGG